MGGTRSRARSFRWALALALSATIGGWFWLRSDARRVVDRHVPSQTPLRGRQEPVEAPPGHAGTSLAGGEAQRTPPGVHRVELLLPPSWKSDELGAMIADSEGLELGTIEVLEGRRVERDFAVPGFPGTIAVRVLVNGRARSGVQVELSMESGGSGFTLGGPANSRGDFGPTPAFPGSWTLRAEHTDEGWRYEHPTPVIVPSVDTCSVEIDIAVIEGTLRFLDRVTGDPLADRDVSLIGRGVGDPETHRAWTTRQTNADGRATWTLVPGDYLFRLEAADQMDRTVGVAWTRSGPVEVEVRL